MYNHFRTLLLNQTYAGIAEEHIPAQFNAKFLTQELQSLHNVLFPVGTSRLYKRFLLQNYLNIIQAAGLEDNILKFDPRITYNKSSDEFFKIYRKSNPNVSDETFPITVSGNYTSNSDNPNYYESFRISQVDDSNDVTVYSMVRDMYIGEAKTLEFVDNVSKPVLIGNSGISFSISSSSPFTSTGDKTWEFLVEAPYNFNLVTLYNRLRSYNTSSLFKGQDVDTLKFKYLWENHFNITYKLAGLLLALVTKIDLI